MSEVKRFALPDAGEGLTDAEIVCWKVRPGDRVAVNQLIVEIETAKSLVDLPCPYAGVVTELLVTEGQTVGVGTPIIAVDTDPDRPEARAATPATPATLPWSEPVFEPMVEPVFEPMIEPVGRTAILVADGPPEPRMVRRPRRRAEPTTEQTEQSERTEQQDQAEQLEQLGQADLSEAPASTVETRSHPATPPAAVPAQPVRTDRPLAEPWAEPLADRPARDLTAVDPVPVSPSPTNAGAGANLTGRPYLTQWLSVDVTRTIKLVRRLRLQPQFAGVRVIPLLVVARAVVLAARRHPEINSAWDQAAQQIVLRPGVNLGIEVATPGGVLRPNIKDADGKSLVALAEAIGALLQTAQDRRTSPADLADGTITITEVGAFAVDGSTPILPPGQAAILAVGQTRTLPWVHHRRVRPRPVLQLSLSFDPRLVDGEQGSRFLADVGAALERPDLMLTW
jgi:2-oxoisovalerate dehydrogenase E2 component (dihydrolipoyl transacylase)